MGADAIKTNYSKECNRCHLLRLYREAEADGNRVEERWAGWLDEEYAVGTHVFVLPKNEKLDPRWRRKPASAGGDGLEMWHGPHWKVYFAAIGNECTCRH